MLSKTEAYGLNFVYPASDKVVGPYLLQHGEFSRVLLDFLLKTASLFEPSTFIDVGANLGTISLPFAKSLPNWKVVSIEAHGGLAGLLHTNTLANRLYNVEVIHAAAGPNREIVNFPATALTAEMNFGTISIGDVSVPTIATVMLTLDDVAPANTRLIKIDVEDFEPQVMQGAQRLLNAQETFWVVETAINFPETSRKTVGIFLDAGYDVYWFFVPFATPNSPKKAPVNSGIGDANIVALPKGSPNIWNLTKVNAATDPRPSNTSQYPYLATYGYS